MFNKGYCYNKNGDCEEDYCRCHSESDEKEEKTLKEIAAAGRKWASYRLLKDFGEDGDGAMPYHGQAPR